MIWPGAEQGLGEINLVVREQLQIVIDFSAVTAMHSCRQSVKETSRLCGCFWSTALKQKEPTSKMCSASIYVASTFFFMRKRCGPSGLLVLAEYSPCRWKEMEEMLDWNDYFGPYL